MSYLVKAVIMFLLGIGILAAGMYADGLYKGKGKNN